MQRFGFMIVNTEPCKEGAVRATKVIGELFHCRSVEFLTSDFALSCSTIWGCNAMKDHPRSGVEAFELFKKVYGTKKTGTMSVQLPASTFAFDVLFTKDLVNDKRKMSDNASASFIPKRSKVFEIGDVMISSSSQHETYIFLNPSHAGELSSIPLSHDSES